MNVCIFFFQNSALLSAKQNLAVEMAETQAAFEEKNSTLSQDLSSHKETIHIMVGEKTEMEKTIKNLEQEVSKKDVEIVTVLSKLSAAEQALNQHLSGPSASNEATEKALKEVSKLKEVLGQKDQLLEEKSNDILELQSRLRQKEEQESEFKLKLKEQGSKLEMAEVHLSQLRRSSPSDTASHKDNEAKEEAFEKKIAEKEEAIKNLEKKVKESKKTEAELTAYIQQTSHDREQVDTSV